MINGTERRQWYPDLTLPFWVFLLSAAPHAPAAATLHCTIGVSEQRRDLWRTVDVFLIFTCAGVQDPQLHILLA